MNPFENIVESPPDPILGLTISYLADKRPYKINLGAGVYKAENLEVCVLNAVKKAEERICKEEKSKDYLPIDGYPPYIQLTKEMVFEDKSLHPSIYGAQTVGGTAALQVGAQFLKERGFHKIYLSDPTWPNHNKIFHHAGFQIESYPYFDAKTNTLNFEQLLSKIEQMEERSIILLQLACHNPTGIDPTENQWQAIFETVNRKKLFPFFDFAYQGFGSSFTEDRSPLSLYLRLGNPCAVAVSHAKNFGIYAERTGALLIFTQDATLTKGVGSRIKPIIRSIYSNPPCHGARIVATILTDPTLKAEWLQELEGMRSRILAMRKALVEGLGPSFEFLLKQRGMFSYTGLKEAQVDRLVSEHAIYLPQDGRINVAGLNRENLEYLVNSIITTLDATL